ncbi:hypothetical protein Goari_000293 [Gossypium aridum]|uniref:Uncharacterized protein n=1 Tax=Gossypium aridum TaxID=34290 RepID=A0A7J8YG81_GOSAI|nr:hypothetical protein [Gossypium aridum]
MKLNLESFPQVMGLSSCLLEMLWAMVLTPHLLQVVLK